LRNPEEPSANSEEPPENSEEAPANPEEQSSDPEEADANPEEEPGNPEERMENRREKERSRGAPERKAAPPAERGREKRGNVFISLVGQARLQTLSRFRTRTILQLFFPAREGGVRGGFALGATRFTLIATMKETPYRSVGVAATFSPRFHQVLAEARRMRERFGATLGFIFVGKRTAAAEAKFADAFETLGLPADSAVHFEEGDPATAIIAAAKKYGFEMLLAGALEREAAHRQFLGNVARRLVREAGCSVLLFIRPEIEPRPLRNIVFLAEYSEQAGRAFRRTLQLAEREKCERLYAIRSYTTFDKARARRRDKAPRAGARTLEEEEEALQQFVLAAGSTPVPIEARCVRGNTGFAASDFVQSVEADLLVVPLDSAPGPETKLPGRIAWVTDVIPCNLWVIRG
jgi:nucleotide-binding universal stress UspA family protein